MRDHSKNQNLRPGWTPKRLIFFVAIMLMFSVPVVGCDLGPDVSGDASQATVTVQVQPSVTHHIERIVNIMPDVTGSYPRSLMLSFLDQMARWVQTLPAVNADQSVVYVSEINHEPYAVSSSPLSFTVPAVPNWPTFQPTPGPSCPSNPYSCSAAQATVTSANAAAARSYQQGVGQVKAELLSAQQATAAQAAKLRALRPATDYSGTSIYGVLNLAAERFSGITAEKWIVAATDLGNNTSADLVLPDLTNVHVVIELYCTSAVVCHNTKATWTRIFQRAHVASVQYLDPQEAATAVSVWA